MWSITFICCWFGANIWKRAPLRLRWYMVLKTGLSVTVSCKAMRSYNDIYIYILNPVILTTLPHGRQSHPTSHILRIPGSHCDSQIMIIPPLTVCLIIFFQSSSHVLHLPQQYWCFPSCHSHRGEQSRQAGEKEQPGFV